MELTRHGTWKRDRRVTLRLNDAMRSEFAAAAAENRHTVAEVMLGALADWCIAREIARSPQGSVK